MSQVYFLLVPFKSVATTNVLVIVVFEIVSSRVMVLVNEICHSSKGSVWCVAVQLYFKDPTVFGSGRTESLE